jgi:hypothetical protein
LKKVKAVFAEPLSNLNLHKLVLDYLKNYAYLGTLESFTHESGIRNLEKSEIAMKRKKLEETEEEKILSLPHRNSLELEDDVLKERVLSVIEEMTLARSKSMDQEVFALGDFKAELLVERGIIREMLVSGEFEKVGEYIKGKFHDLWANDKNIRVSIWALQFIELLKKRDMKAAIDFASSRFNEEGGHFVTFSAEGFEERLELNELFGLLCYTQIEDSNMKHLLLPIQREAVSDYIGKRILEMKGISGTTVIEKTLKQLIVSQNSILEAQNLNSIFKLSI